MITASLAGFGTETETATAAGAAPCHTARQFWSRHRESTLNWIALGMLLAAWNSADQDAAAPREPAVPAMKGHKSVNTL